MIRPVFYLFFLCTYVMGAQVTFIIDSLPKTQAKNSAIYISGDFEGWTGGQKKYKLTYGNGQYSITLPVTKKNVLFKFTQGSWKNVEKNKDGNDITNRKYVPIKDKDTVYIQIKSWQSDKKDSSNDLNVYTYAEAFVMPELDGRKRKIWMYLPPNYNSSKEHYPVIYMHDGQNIFNQATSYAGEWHVDETLNELYLKQKKKFIVIAIANGDSLRIEEYTPWKNKKYGGGRGDDYLNFIVHTLKPQVDAQLRTLSGPKNTAIIGSSLGGLISMYAGLKYPQVFGKIGVFSPAFWINPSVFDYAKTHAKIPNQKIYFNMGELEGSEPIDQMHKMIKTIEQNGFPSKNINEKIIPKGAHNETTWSADFKAAVLWLFDEKTTK